MVDPLVHFLRKYGFDAGKVLRTEAGKKYAGVMLADGRIGVCSKLMVSVSPADLHFDHPDLEHPAHRVIYNAYLNALLNYHVEFEDEKDIFSHVDFGVRQGVTMVGFFRPLVKKFREAGLKVTVFDLLEDDPELAPLSRLDEHLADILQNLEPFAYVRKARIAYQR